MKHTNDNRGFGFRVLEMKGFLKGLAFGVLVLVLSLGLVWALQDVVLYTIHEPPGMDTIGPRYICGLPFPSKAACAGDTVMGNFARGSQWNTLMSVTFLWGVGLLFFTHWISAFAKRIAWCVVVLSGVGGLVGTILHFARNLQ